MKITLSTTSGAPRTFSNTETANLFCRGLLGRFSYVYYTIQDGNFERNGSIDLEPVSFHARNKSAILTSHLNTYARNVLAAIAANKYPFSTLCESDRERYTTAYTETLALIK